MNAKIPQGTAEQIEKTIRAERRSELFYEVGMGIETFAGLARHWNHVLASSNWKPVSRRAVATWWRREFVRHFPRPTSFGAAYARLGGD